MRHLRVVARFHKLYGAFLRLARRTRILDKYPEALFRIPFLLQIFPDARFIWVVRDGYDTIASIEKLVGHSMRANLTACDRTGGVLTDRKWKALVTQVCSKMPAFEGNVPELTELDRDIDKAAVEWTASVNRGLQEEENYPGKILRIQFEELSRQPEFILGRVLSFCDLDGDRAVFDFAKSKLGPVPTYDVGALAPVVQGPFTEAIEALASTTKGWLNE